MQPGPGDKKLVRVIIFHQPYTLRATGEAHETEEHAASVDALMNQIAAKSTNADASRVAVLAALHLADKLRRLEEQISDFSERAGRLSDLAADIASED
jgi:cell division protein ZapA